jgi:hypothetical protein
MSMQPMPSNQLNKNNEEPHIDLKNMGLLN